MCVCVCAIVYKCSTQYNISSDNLPSYPPDTREDSFVCYKYKFLALSKNQITYPCNVETSYFTQLKICYLMTTFRCPSNILIT